MPTANHQQPLEGFDTPRAHDHLTNDKRRAQWLADCQDGPRAADGLTDPERRILLELRMISHEVAAENRYGRYIRRQVA